MNKYYEQLISPYTSIGADLLCIPIAVHHVTEYSCPSVSIGPLALLELDLDEPPSLREQPDSIPSTSVK